MRPPRVKPKPTQASPAQASYREPSMTRSTCRALASNPSAVTRSNSLNCLETPRETSSWPRSPTVIQPLRSSHFTLHRTVSRGIPVALATLAPAIASADRWEVRREVREGARGVERERREAERELRRCKTREARHEIRREISRDYYRDQYYRGGNRWYRDGRYRNEYDFECRYYRGRNRGNNNDLLKGVVIGAAAVGVIVAITEANED